MQSLYNLQIMKSNFFLCFLLFSFSLSSQINWEPLAPLNLEDVEIIHVSEDRMLGTVDIPPRLVVSEDLGTTWMEIIDIPQLNLIPLVDIDRDGNYLVLFDQSVYKLDPDGYFWTLHFLLPEAPVVWNDIAAFSNGNILIRERRGIRLYDEEGNFLKEETFGNTVTKNFIKGEGDEHYFFLSPGNVFGYIVKINSDMDILESYPADQFYVHAHFDYDGSRFYSTTGYSDDGRTWTEYEGGLKGNITILNNGDIHLIEGCNGATSLEDFDCTKIYVSHDKGETFEYKRDIDLGIRLPSPGRADLRRTTLQGGVPIGDEGFVLFHEKLNYYSPDGEDVWTPLGVDFGLPSMNRVEAATKENVFAGLSFWHDFYAVSDNLGWSGLSATACGDRPRVTSLFNGNLIGFQGCISENQGVDWNTIDASTNQAGVKDDVVYAYSGKKVYSSSDFGQNWIVDLLPDDFPLVEIVVMDYSSEGYVYFWDFKTASVLKYSILDSTISYVSFENEEIRRYKTAYKGSQVYAITTNTLQVSEDNAETFVERNLPPITPVEIKEIYVDHENALYVYSDKNIWISYDEGITWLDISPNFQDLYEINEIDVSWDGYIFVATDGTPILRSNKSEIMQLVDNDGDGFYSTEDCDDNNPDVNPNQEEVAYNGLDDDCDPATLDDDLDQDGFLLADDCDDTNADINPNAEEIADNQIDEDCDGFDLITSIFELSNSALKIYPNPVIDFINIEISGQLEYQINIFDFEGKLVHSSVNSSQISTSSFSAGTYLIEVKDLNSAQKIIERIVVEN